MKLLIVIPYYTFGGIEKQVLFIASGLKRRGVDVSVFATTIKKSEPLKKELIKADIKVGYLTEIQNVFNGRPIKRLSKVFQLRKRIKNLGFTTVMPFTNHPCFVFASLWKLLGLKVCLYQYRGGAPKKDSGSLYWVLEKLFRPIYIANSHHVRQKYALVKEMDEQNIITIPNILEKKFASVPNRYLPLKECNEILIVSVSNFFPQKDHYGTLLAFHKLLLGGVRAKLVLVGNTHHSPQLYHQVKAYIQKHKLDKHVTLLGAINDVYNVLEIADLAILNSSSEGCPNVLLEYMSAGLPFISTNIPACKEFSPKTQHHYMFKYQDIDTLYELLNCLVLDVKLRTELGSANKKFANQFFEKDKIIDCYYNLLR